MKRLLQHGSFTVIMVAVFVTGYRGIDFGGHWDEPRMRRTVWIAVRDHHLLPGWYNYPSVTYGLTAASLAPEIVEQWNNGGRTIQSIRTSVFDHSGTLRARTTFLAVTTLSLLWVYLTVLAWRKRWMEALLAAALLGTSWEVAYQARWIAPDGVLMQFAALFLLLMVLALTREHARGRLFIGAAVVAGLACGSKYPGGILLFPLAYYAYKSGGWRLTLRAAAVFAVVFIVTTPGALIQFRTFVHDVGYEIRHYAGGHPGYTVKPGPEHMGLILQYLALVAFSKYVLIAVGVFAFAMLGAFRVWRKDRWIAGIMLWLPLAYFLYMGSQRVMFVRNLLILMPILAILAARGIAWTTERLPGIAVRTLVLAVVWAAMVVNFAWLVNAADSIVNRDSLPHKKNILAYINAHQGDVFFVSGNVAHVIEAEPLQGFPADLTQNRAEASRYIVDTCDAFDRKWWPGNHRGRWQVVSGPYEVNFDYYPTWGGNCRYVACSAAVGENLPSFRGEAGTGRRPHTTRSPLEQ
jgi:hypothetical protein